MACGVEVWGRADGSQVAKTLEPFGWGRLREEVDGVGWVPSGLGWLT